MIVSRPPFLRSVHWRPLTPAERGDGPWKYILIQNLFIVVETGVTRHYDCCGSDGHVWLKILPHGLWISCGYAWNGNTAAPDCIFGIDLLLESVPHDALFQFSGCSGFPCAVTLTFANRLYYALAPRITAWIYLAGLTLGSWALWGRSPMDGEYVTSHPLTS